MLSNHVDRAILREGLKLLRKIAQVDPIKSFLGEETSPGSSVNSDEEWDTWIANNSVTEYHPSSTMAMLPQAKGGVVDADCMVYGLSNVRVVDSSVFPLSFSSHVRSPVQSSFGIGTHFLLLVDDADIWSCRTSCRTHQKALLLFPVD